MKSTYCVWTIILLFILNESSCIENEKSLSGSILRNTQESANTLRILELINPDYIISDSLEFIELFEYLKIVPSDRLLMSEIQYKLEFSKYDLEPKVIDLDPYINSIKLFNLTNVINKNKFDENYANNIQYIYSESLKDKWAKYHLNKFLFLFSGEDFDGFVDYVLVGEYLDDKDSCYFLNDLFSIVNEEIFPELKQINELIDRADSNCNKCLISKIIYDQANDIDLTTIDIKSCGSKIEALWIKTYQLNQAISKASINVEKLRSIHDQLLQEFSLKLYRKSYLGYMMYSVLHKAEIFDKFSQGKYSEMQMIILKGNDNQYLDPNKTFFKEIFTAEIKVMYEKFIEKNISDEELKIFIVENFPELQEYLE